MSLLGKADPLEDERTMLRRQRTRLMAISVITLLYVLAGISLTKISIFGNTFDITRPEYLEGGLWIGWGYWLWRFLQYFRELKYGEPRLIFNREMPAVLLKIVKKRVLQNPDFKEEHAKCRSRVSAVLTAAEPPAPDAYFWEIGTEYATRCRGKSHSEMGYQENERVMGTELRWARIRVIGRMVFFTPYFTDHVLPLLLATLPVLAAVCRYLEL